MLKDDYLKRISVYVRNHNSGPSCYYRIYQYFDSDEFFGCDVKCHDLMSNSMFKINMSIRTGILRYIVMLLLYMGMVVRMLVFILEDIISKPDVIIVSRTTIPRRTPFFIKPFIKNLYKNSKLIWDFDDNIIYSKEVSSYEKDLLIKYSNHIIVTNEYLKGTLPDDCMSKVTLLSTTDGDFSGININKSICIRRECLNKSINIVWSGTSSNLDNIRRIVPYLEEYAKKSSVKVKLFIVCNVPFWYEAKNDRLSVISYKWSRSVAIKCISRAHIGIMPLFDNEFTRGKGGFKLIQYMAAGVPVVASPVGFNCEIVKDTFGVLCNDKDIFDAFNKILKDPDTWADMAAASYNEYVNNYSYGEHLKIIKQLVLS